MGNDQNSLRQYSPTASTSTGRSGRSGEHNRPGCNSGTREQSSEGVMAAVQACDVRMRASIVSLFACARECVTDEQENAEAWTVVLLPQEGSGNHKSRRKREATSLRCAHACRTTTGVCHSCHAHHACTTPTRQHTSAECTPPTQPRAAGRQHSLSKCIGLGWSRNHSSGSSEPRPRCRGILCMCVSEGMC